MEHKNCNHDKDNNRGNGFLLGVIVGVLVTLLFTTKKGRDLMKEWTEKGLEKAAGLQEALKEKKEEFRDALDEVGIDEEENDYVEPQEVRYLAEDASDEEGHVSDEPKKVQHPKAKLTEKVKVESNGDVKPVGASKRFFLRRPQKKS